MAAFVTTSDYVSYYTDASDTELAQLAANLEEACDKIRDYLCQQVDLVAADVVTVWGTGTRALTLPELPIVAVSSIVCNGTAITDYTVDQYGLVWRNQTGYTSWAQPGYWPAGLQYVITYTHGYATVPGIIKTTALRLARLAIGRPDGVAQESVAGYSATYLTDDDVLSVLQRRIVKRIAVP